MTAKPATKEKIAREALDLFAEKGYSGTSMKNIAAAVGIKDSSIYKHYGSKQEILDTITAVIEKHIEEMSEGAGLPTGGNYEGAAAFYGALGADELAGYCRKIFLFYLKDDMMAKFRRMGRSEQFEGGRIRELYRQLFFDDSITYLTGLFAEMIRCGVLKSADPEVTAMSFYAPVFFLLEKYSNREGCEDEASAILEKQIREFYRVYGKVSDCALPSEEV